MEVDDEQFLKDMDTVQEIVFEDIFPMLDEIEEDYPEQSAYHTTFVSSMHILFQSGWTKEELLKEVAEHFEIHLENENHGELH